MPRATRHLDGDAPFPVHHLSLSLSLSHVLSRLCGDSPKLLWRKNNASHHASHHAYPQTADARDLVAFHPLHLRLSWYEAGGVHDDPLFVSHAHTRPRDDAPGLLVYHARCPCPPLYHEGLGRGASVLLLEWHVLCRVRHTHHVRRTRRRARLGVRRGRPRCTLTVRGRAAGPRPPRIASYLAMRTRFKVQPPAT